MTDRATAKSERLLQIEALLLHHPERLSQAELARRLGVHRSTINRDLPELTNRFAIYESGDGRLMMQLDRPFPLRANLIANSKNEMSIQQDGKAGEAIRNGKFYMKLNLMSK